ncbi:helix-turn-helix domain-containing protein [Shewanella woodyi]|uniref:Transcriptional regulator, XRE family n=1 Tax=Shewanella woodyi (strain ATCC 51908 / MS32) TaxID=392500 RepID=B1KN13_SHEWM|nr:helix-turn-helix transcriptional regulator [Shewanella woodyi]ACA88970.1 transcriptional regulator, XRE family [Shewanella woodyi ATCC 51908]
MILAEKIIRLRKQLGWSQEELAEKMAISRQSVSKWESANSIPDLNKIIKLADIFEVSTDFLLKDEYEANSYNDEPKPSNLNQVSLEQATQYVNSKIQEAALITKGVILSVCSAIPLFFFLAMAETQRMGITDDAATTIGLVCVLMLVATAVSFFIKTNQFKNETAAIENQDFELAYGVHSIFSERLAAYQPRYNRSLFIAISLFIFSFVPLIVVNQFFDTSGMVLMMIAVLLLMVSAGLFFIIPASTKLDAYNHILQDKGADTEQTKRNKRAEKLAAFYWPLLIAIFLGWSLWTMDWGTTWIIWPVGAILFAALVGLMELLEKPQNN